MEQIVKLADIAEAVGVSTVSVSKALSGQKGVSDEMRKKIKETAEKMGYVKPVATKKTKVKEGGSNIGILMAERYASKYTSFYWHLYQEVSKAAMDQACYTMFEIVDISDEEQKKIPKIVLENKVDGIIVIGKMDRDYLANFQKKYDIPTVYLDFYDDMEVADAVISNSFYGEYLLCNFLHNLGHEKIAFVGTVGATKSITDRYLGYRKCLIENDIEFKKDYVIEDRDQSNSRMVEEDKIKMPKDMPTAFVCNCDLTAAYVINRLQKDGYRVPEDISVVGFDDFLFPGLCNTGITTYEVNMTDMARISIEKVINKISNPNYKPGVFIVEGQLIERDSTAPVK
ncbi:MAG: LacI family DNA-binding transcriptional regulator [Pseudobutyrivibrio sp.]|nr:LacI family DNA-binding transcriptional regulator [Pseudobutyrivibrio sp.]